MAQTPPADGPAAAAAPETKADTAKPPARGVAKTSAKPGANKPGGEKNSEEAPAPPPPPSKPKDGDSITLKDGTVIDGVQIVKESPKELIVQVISGVELAIPRQQVVSIKRDEISALDVKRGVTAAAKKSPDAEFSGKLGADISNPPAEFKDEDLGIVLAEVCQRAGVDVVLDQSLEELPEAERHWTYELDGKAPRTLFDILNEELPGQFPDLEVLCLENKVVVATKKAVQTLKDKGAVELPKPGKPAAPAEAVAATEVPPAEPAPADADAKAAPAVPPAPKN